ncbi:family 43 glycosylhydrolase [Oligoflexus tunisiensis]|uniref:family 43 glycosylhydrolase n=1 Tax=Oligoflexus tunisiensis TaxID=708132 RepID=UPI000ADFD781|nr:family 43 glycosylhydrolase [Oligoflexus tunisiensis]
MRPGPGFGLYNVMFLIALILSGCRPRLPEINLNTDSFQVVGASGSVFRNPIVSSGADPWVMYKDGFYYYCRSDGRSTIYISKARSLLDIGRVPSVKVWEAPRDTEHSHQLWAPELQFLDGRWYIYYAASDGDNETHRMFVLESEGTDALGPYQFKGKIAPATDRWAIDGTILEADDGRRYFIWSGWDDDRDITQNLYMAPMTNPWTLQQPDQPFIRMEAEQAVLQKALVRPERWASEGMTVGNIDQADSFVEFAFETPRAGDYQIDIRYANGTEAVSTHVLKINDGPQEIVSYPSVGWDNFQTVQAFASLAAGPTTLRFAKGEGFAELDRIEVKPVGSDRVVLSIPEHDFERKGGAPYVNEGPQVLARNGKIHVIYSGSASWTDHYNLIQLTFQGGAIMNRQNWVKHGPTFSRTMDVFGPGHASFTRSPDGLEDWIVYHAARYRGAGWDRDVRAQRFTWDENDNPVFGQPKSLVTEIPVPSGSVQVAGP